MKYHPPFGVTDEDAPYINGDPTIAQEGSIPPAESIEYPQREIVNFIVKSDFTPTDGDLTQLTRAARSQYVNFCVDSGAVNALSVALDPPLQGYKQGLILRVKVANTNTGATTINVNALGGRPVKRANGADLVAGDIIAGGIANLVDEGTHFQILNFLGALGGTTNNYFIDIPYAEDTSITPNSVVAAFTPPITAPVAGDVILVKLANINTSAVNITVNALAAKPIRRTDGQPLQSRDHDTVGETILLEYSVAFWQMMRLVRSQVFFKLSADLTLYVRPDGDDSHDGSINDAAHAFKTIQGAINFVAASYLIAGRTVTIQLGVAGTYTGRIAVANLPGNIIIRGDPVNRSSYIHSHTPAGPPEVNCMYVQGSGANVTCDGFTFFNGSANYNTVMVLDGASMLFKNMRFTGVSATASGDVYANGSSQVTASDYIDFYRNSHAAFTLWNGSSLTIGDWFTLITTNGVNFASAFLELSTLGSSQFSPGMCGFAGTATGKRYLAILNSVINVRGAAQTYLPGNMPGVVDASSVYG
jgi:hypothetical protein